MKTEWIYCPICNSKTRVKIKETTEARNLPVFCPKCKNTFNADIKPGFNVQTKLYTDQSQLPDTEPVIYKTLPVLQVAGFFYILFFFNLLVSTRP